MSSDLTFTIPSVDSLTIAESITFKSAANSTDPDIYTFPTLRDNLAMAALTGIMAHQNTQQNTPHHVADEAYNVADAMLERRKR